MLRGSRPGERRGGRKRDTPNRRTILTDRILSIGLDRPTASRRAFLLKLVKDRKLPADTRMAVAPECFPPKRTGRRPALAGVRIAIAQQAIASQRPAVAPIQDWNPQSLDALFGIVQDATVDPNARRKAALKIAEFLLPKVGKKAKALPDEYGFFVNANLASAYRDIELELRALVNGPTRKIPAVAEKIKKLQARSDAIRRRLEVPCPTKYGHKEAADDYAKLLRFASLRDNETTLTETQQAEEAHLKVRFDVFAHSPEQIARRRLKALGDAELLFKKNRFFGDCPAKPLSRKDRNDLALLQRLYSKSSRSIFQRDGDELETLRDCHDDLEMSHYHPFKDEWPSRDNNFYPPHSKVRPIGVVTLTWSGPAPPLSSWPSSCRDAPVNDPIQSAEP
jgi:hypothetical protein